MTIDDSQDGGSFDFKPGDVFEIVLKETPTAGYRWRLELDGKPYILALNDSFVPGAAPGAAGQHRWKLQAHQPGEARLVFWYGRSWEPEPARSFSVTVRIASDNQSPGTRRG